MAFCLATAKEEPSSDYGRSEERVCPARPPAGRWLKKKTRLCSQIGRRNLRRMGVRGGCLLALAPLLLLAVAIVLLRRRYPVDTDRFDSPAATALPTITASSGTMEKMPSQRRAETRSSPGSAYA